MQFVNWSRWRRFLGEVVKRLTFADRPAQGHSQGLSGYLMAAFCHGQGLPCGCQLHLDSQQVVTRDQTLIQTQLSVVELLFEQFHTGFLGFHCASSPQYLNVGLLGFEDEISDDAAPLKIGGRSPVPGFVQTKPVAAAVEKIVSGAGFGKAQIPAVQLRFSVSAPVAVTCL